MPFIGYNTTRTLAQIIVGVSAILLLFGSIPFVNVSVGTPLFMGVTFGTFIGVALLWAVWQMYKGHA